MTKEKGGEHSDGKIIEFMRENGTKASQRGLESKFGQTEEDTKVLGTKGSRSGKA